MMRKKAPINGSILFVVKDAIIRTITAIIVTATGKNLILFNLSVANIRISYNLILNPPPTVLYKSPDVNPPAPAAASSS